MAGRKPTTPSAQRDFLAEVNFTNLSGKGGPEFWAQKSGGDVQAETTKAYDGGKVFPQTLGGPPSVDDITVTAPYERERDWDLYSSVQAAVGQETADITVRNGKSSFNSGDVQAQQGGLQYSKALLKSVKGPDVDASSGSASTWSLTFTPNGAPTVV